MGSKTQQVGGGSSTPVANQWNQYLGNMLPGGNLGGAQPRTGQSGPSGGFGGGLLNSLFPSGVPKAFGGPGIGQAGSQTPQQQQYPPQGTPFTQAIDSFLSGGGSNNAMNMFQNAQGGVQLPQLFQAGQYNTQLPQFQGANLQNPNLNPLSFGSVDFSNPQTAGQYQNDPDIMNALKGRFADSANTAGQVNFGGPSGVDFSMPDPHNLNYDFNSEIANAAGGGLERSMDRALADSRARATAGGGSSLGTGAATERALTMAEMAPQIQQAKLQALMAQNQQGMQNYGQNTGLMLQNRGLESQFNLGAGDQALRAAIAGANNSLLNRDQTLQALGLAGNLGLGANAQNLQAAQQNNQAMNAFDSLRLGQQQGLNSNNLQQLLGLGGLQNDANRNLLAQSGMANDFNMQGFQSQNQVIDAMNRMGFNIDQSNIANLMNNQNMQNQFQLNAGQLGLGMDQLSQAGQMGILDQLFRSFQQSNQLGTPQAQTIQKPSGFSQVMGGLSGIAGLIPGIGQGINAIGGLFGGGGGGGGGQAFNPTQSYYGGPFQLPGQLPILQF